jgi:hypothetical protein
LVAAQEWSLLADEMPDDFLVWVLARTPDTRGDPGDRHLAALQLVAGLPTQEVPSPRDDSRVYLSLTSKVMGEIEANLRATSSSYRCIPAPDSSGPGEQKIR